MKIEENFETINFDNWKVRCSSISEIITKSNEITKGVESFLKKEYNKIARGFEENFSNKYVQKGIYCQEDSASMIQKEIFDNKTLIISNKERRKNDFINGECDFYLEEFSMIIDAKNSYSWGTFNDAELTSDYEWQLRGYMWLWGAENAKLIYTLFNLPENQLVALERKMFYEKMCLGAIIDSDYVKECEKIRENFNFEKFSNLHRIKIFDIERDLEKEKVIESMVVKSRIFLNEFHKKEKERVLKKIKYEKNK